MAADRPRIGHEKVTHAILYQAYVFLHVPLLGIHFGINLSYYFTVGL